MAQAKTNRGDRKKRTATSRFYVVTTAQRARRRVADKLEGYSDTYISRPIEKGKALMTDLRQAPRKTLAAWLEEGKEMITDLNQETRSTVTGMVKDGKALLTKAGKAPRQTLNAMVDDGRDLMGDLRKETRSRLASLQAEARSMAEGIGKDAQRVADEVISGGRQALNKVTGKLKVDRAIRRRIRTLPAQLNLPSKRDIDGLARRVGALNKKVDALHRAVAA
jgi:hypothetical protein